MDKPFGGNAKGRQKYLLCSNLYQRQNRILSSWATAHYPNAIHAV